MGIEELLTCMLTILQMLLEYHRLQLSPMFNIEMTESIEHADIVRKGIVQLGGIPVWRNTHPITHMIILKC